jgi:hypothetical protein
MNDPIAALLYLLGRHVATALRVRREDEEIVLSRHQAPPLRELHDALERGEQITIDPWVDLEDGARGLVCLWARTPCPEVTVDDLPAALRPQAWVRQGGSALVVWSLAEPNTQPGGIDPARAMREIAAALGITACDPRDYIPVPRDPQDLVIIEPGRDIDGAQMVQWAQSTLSDRRGRQRQRREHEDAMRRAALAPSLLRAIAAVAEIRRGHEEAAARAVIAGVERSREEPAEGPPRRDPAAVEEPITAGAPESEIQQVAPRDDDPWATPLEDSVRVKRESRAVVSSAETDVATPTDIRHAIVRARSEMPSRPYYEDDISAEVRSRLAHALTEARDGTSSEARLHATLVESMAALGTRDVWAALGVAMTWLRDGKLYGLRGDRWVSLRGLFPTD